MAKGKNINKWKEEGKSELIMRICADQSARAMKNDGLVNDSKLNLPIEFFPIIMGIQIPSDKSIEDTLVFGKYVNWIK